MFTKGFDKYACFGDTIECEVDGYTFVARLEFDTDYRIDDDDCHNVDRSVTGCTEEQHAELLEARAAWFRDEWSYVGVVVSVSRNGVELDDHAASVWGMEMNYPGCDNNAHLTDIANELIDEAKDVAGHARQKILKEAA